MFLSNKYALWYFQIVENARRRVSEGYSEQHHIIPKSLGGSNLPENLVSLSAREHFICHLLLTKMTSGEDRTKMQWALQMMRRGNNRQKQRYTPSARLYEVARKACAIAVSATHKGKPKSETAREKMRQAWVIRRARKAAGMESRRPMSEEARLNIARAKVGKPLSEKHKASISAGLMASTLNMGSKQGTET